mgnify:CR=1 FL=1
MKTPDVKVLVPLKKVCALAEIDPKLARRFLREKVQRPGGRWAWPQKRAAAIVELLRKEVVNGPE